YFDIGVAVSTERGLVVPVVRDADALSLAQIEAAIGDFGARARDNKLKLEELQGGTFTITNGGVFGSLMSTPILNSPQSGVLGMHKIQQRPVAIDGKIEIRPMMYLALSYDHRLIDGREAVTFLVRVKENLEDPQRLLLDVRARLPRFRFTLPFTGGSKNLSAAKVFRGGESGEVRALAVKLSPPRNLLCKFRPSREREG